MYDTLGKYLICSRKYANSCENKGMSPLEIWSNIESRSSLRNSPFQQNFQITQGHPATYK